MKFKQFSALCLILIVVAGVYFSAAVSAGQATEPRQDGKNMVAHNVYFTLKDQSEPAKAKLVQASRTHLKGHPGEVFFAAGVLAADLKREVNVTDFDVSLHLVFKTKVDQDRYQKAPRHLKFIEENRDNWEKVRVFDSYVE
jgi:hypothetical protein